MGIQTSGFLMVSTSEEGEKSGVIHNKAGRLKFGLRIAKCGIQDIRKEISSYAECGFRNSNLRNEEKEDEEIRRKKDRETGRSGDWENRT
jgi:hypothetical protein